MKWTAWFLFIFILFITVVVVNQYFFCPRYNFVKTPPFSGSLIYNPYEEMDSTQWRKCNFHTHVKHWMGITNGKGTAEDAWNIYTSLGYDVHCISNYQSITDYKKDDPAYIPAYEHGYGMKKNHQTVLGTAHVMWFDYLLPQTLNNKQYILSKLCTNDSITVNINHPELRHGFTPNDMQYLSGYNCIEVFPHNSFAQWDAALSAGKPVFIVSDDDAHDVTDPNQVGENCTWVNSPGLDQKSILDALKKGKSYAMVMDGEAGDSFDTKRKKIKEGLPIVERVEVINDSLKITISKEATQFRFIGQGGKILEQIEHSHSASRRIAPNDTYLRTRIFFSDATEIDLNPVFRYNGTLPVFKLPEVNESSTLIFRSIGIAIILAVAFGSFSLLRRRHKINRVS